MYLVLRYIDSSVSDYDMLFDINVPDEDGLYVENFIEKIYNGIEKITGRSIVNKSDFKFLKADGTEIVRSTVINNKEFKDWDELILTKEV